MLNPRQLRFIEEYVVSLNATRAALRAGYSAKTARAIGSENLRKFEIATAIARRLETEGILPRSPLAFLATGARAFVRIEPICFDLFERCHAGYKN